MRPRPRHRRAQDRRAGRARLLQLLPLGRCRGERGRPAPSGDAPPRARSSCARATPHQVPAGGALAVDRDGFSAAVTRRARSASARHDRARRDRRPAAGGVVIGHRRDRPPHLSGPGRGDPAADRREGARLLRRHRADRPSRLDRHGRGLVPVALRQGRPGRHRARTTSTARSTATSTRPSSTRCSRATRPSSRNGRARPISTAACRSR